MASREAFLGALRARLARPAPPNLAHPLEEAGGVPPVRYPEPLDDPPELFCRVAREVGTRVRRLSSPQDLERLVAEVVGAHRVRSAVVSADPETLGVAEALERAGVEVLPFGGVAAAARADLGVTGAAWGIAATGTLVLDARRAGGRSASLLPGVHLGLVRADRILPEPGALLRAMQARLPGGLPSQLVLASGPSRSADIEATLTLGVHGPGEVWVGVLDAGGN